MIDKSYAKIDRGCVHWLHGLHIRWIVSDCIPHYEKKIYYKKPMMEKWIKTHEIPKSLFRGKALLEKFYANKF